MVVPKIRRPTDPGAAPGGELTDPELCDGLAAGEPWAAEALYDRVEDVVDGVLFRLLGPGDAEREDLSQQALERVISTVAAGRFARGCSLRSWTTLITQHVAIDALRARARERSLFDRNAPHDAVERVAMRGETPERAAEGRQRIERLLGALAALKRDRVEAVVLHDVLGHDLTEIARLTGVSVAAAQSRLVRGRREAMEWIRHREKSGGKDG
jgi:RNA polymerase sigma-70 factor (ECF subfamily)